MKETVYIKLSEAYICPECDLMRKGPGPCACGQSQTAPVVRALRHPAKDPRDAAIRVFARGRENLHKRLPETFCRTCQERLHCVEDCPPSYCPLGLKEPRPAA